MATSRPNRPWRAGQAAASSSAALKTEQRSAPTSGLSSRTASWEAIMAGQLGGRAGPCSERFVGHDDESKSRPSGLLTRSLAGCSQRSPGSLGSARPAGQLGRRCAGLGKLGSTGRRPGCRLAPASAPNWLADCISRARRRCRPHSVALARQAALAARQVIVANWFSRRRLPAACWSAELVGPPGRLYRRRNRAD